MRYKLTQDKRRNRAVLKRFLRNHARMFDMGAWLVLEAPVPFDYALAYTEVSPAAPTAEDTLKKFEECGTSCCIAGAMRVLTGYDLVEDYHAEDIFGLPNYTVSRSLYLSSQWPDKLYLEYVNCRERQDYSGMVKAAIQAIDHFAIKE